MIEFLLLPGKERALYIEQAAANLGYHPAVVEKDFWVCWALGELFSLPEWGGAFLFKGGTSLSKGWNLIHRFSEDIDMVISRELPGFPEDHSLGSKMRKRLRSKCAERVAGELLPLMGERLRVLPVDGNATLRMDPEDPEHQTILFEYPRTSGPAPEYLRPAVKMEFGARSDTWPCEQVEIGPMLEEGLPGVFEWQRIEVLALSPRRTFWEKVMLLHEEQFRPPRKPRRARLARHYYDVWSLLAAGIGREALEDECLFEEVAEHRRVFFRQSWVDYATLRRGTLSLIPPPDGMSYWRNDYEEMRTFFTGGEPPEWEEILDAIRRFERDFNAG